MSRSPRAFDRSWENFNRASDRACRLTRPQFAALVLRAPELFAGYVVEAAKSYITSRPLSRRGGPAVPPVWFH